MKRIFDFCVSLISLLALFPLFLIIIFLIKLTSKGPAFFKQERIGLNGMPFTMLKFRTMRIHDDSEYVQTVENDKRITFVGKYLRKSSIDELPQLFNILIHFIVIKYCIYVFILILHNIYYTNYNYN